MDDHHQMKGNVVPLYGFQAGNYTLLRNVIPLLRLIEGQHRPKQRNKRTTFHFRSKNGVFRRISGTTFYFLFIAIVC